MIKVWPYINLIRLNKPIGIFLLLWPTLSALWLSSNGMPDSRLLCIFILGVILTRSLGCAINDIFDIEIDKRVSRTKNRPLALGQISFKETLYFIFFLGALSFWLVLQLNLYAIKIAFIALIFITLYPITKRFLPIPQAFLGVTFGFGILMSFAVTQNQIPVEAWMLFIANAFWVLAYDTHYAVVDMIDDKKIKIKSSPLTFGRKTMMVILFCYFMTFFILMAIGVLSDFKINFFIALLVAFFIALYVWQKCLSFDPNANFNAFKLNNYVGFFIFLGFLSQS